MMNTAGSIKSIVSSRWVLIATFAVAVAVGFYVSYAWAATVNCSSSNPCVGTNGDDTINGTSGYNIIYGLAGNDVIGAGGGNDEVYAHGGADDVYGGPGNDEVHGGPGDDFVLYDVGVYGNAGNDWVYGDDGLDSLYGNAGNDNLFGGNQDDLLHAEDNEQDWLDGGAGSNICWYDNGLDVVVRCQTKG